MRAATGFAALLASCVLIGMTPSPASSLPGVAEGIGAAGAGLVEQAGSRHAKSARKHRTGRPHYAPYFCSKPYQYRYWQFYAPICYPLNRPLPQYKR